MELIADDQRGLPHERMKWIKDLNLTSQTFGIMASRLIAEGSAPRPCIASSSPPR
jgi:hypothetical protein